MPVYVSPGVYIREIDLSLYAPQISTCILANLGTATKGPVNKPIYVSTHTQFIREFGNPHSDHLATLAHLQFLAKGNQSYFTRVTDGTETHAATEVPAPSGPAVITGTEMGPFTITASSYGTIQGLEAESYNITESYYGGFASGTPGLIGVLTAISDGELAFTYVDRDGNSTGPIDVGPIDLTTETTYADVAAVVETAIRLADSAFSNITVNWESGPGVFTCLPDPVDTGDVAEIAFSTHSVGGGTDLTLLANMNWVGGSWSPGSNGNDVMVLSVDGLLSQEVRLTPGAAQTAADVADDINNQTSGITAWAETIGANSFVYMRTNTPGSAGQIEALAVAAEIEAYTDVLGVSIPAIEVGGDGTDQIILYHRPFAQSWSQDSSANLSNFQSVSDGSLRVNLDGDGVEEATGMDFTSATSLEDVASIIETAVNNLSWTDPNKECRVFYNNNKFVMISYDYTTPAHGLSSTVAVSAGTTGTNILQNGYWQLGGASVSGAVPQTFVLPAGSSITTDAVVSAISASISGATVENDGGYVKFSSTEVGPQAVMFIHADSSADVELGFDDDYYWGTGSQDATFTLYAPTPGTDGNNLSATVSEGYQKTLHEQWLTDNGYSPGDPEEADSPYYEYREAFKIDLYYSGVRIGSYDNLTVNDPTYDSYIETQLGTLTSDYNPARLVVVEDAGSGLYPAYGTYEFGATSGTLGSDGNSSLVDADYIGVVAGPTGAPTGMQVYANAETFDMNLLIVPGVASTNVHTAMIVLCETRADAMCILDPPFGLSGPQSVVDWSNKQGSYGPGQAINSSYAAIYWPWIKVYDSVNAEEVWTPPSGHAAAVYAYTDYISEPWFAPAGYNRAHIVVGIDLEMSPSQGDRNLMYGYPNVVNPIVNFFPDGITIWGQKTTQRRPSATDRVNVRRLLLYARKLVATVVRYLVFEPNDEVTWRWFEALCEPIFENIQRRRGLYEFRVVCDETTNPPYQIDRSEMNGRIYLKPTKAAEVITVDFVITTTGANFDELEY